jgi:ribosomal protein S18 acetylase RimI-like enzyme
LHGGIGRETNLAVRWKISGILPWNNSPKNTGAGMQDNALYKTSETEIVFREATANDLEDVAFLLGHLGYPLHPDQLKEIYLLLLSDQQSRILLALDGSRAVGMIHLRAHPALRLNGYHVSIEELVVHPEFRGRGIGKELLDAAVLYARMRNAVLLEVHTSNKRESLRRGFYAKNGFVQAHSTLYRRELQAPSDSELPMAEAWQRKYTNSAKRTCHG